VTEGGEMRNFELSPGTSVRIAERDLTDEVGRYLNLVGSSRARDLRRMMIAATGSGDRWSRTSSDGDSGNRLTNICGGG